MTPSQLETVKALITMAAAQQVAELEVVEGTLRVRVIVRREPVPGTDSTTGLLAGKPQRMASTDAVPGASPPADVIRAAMHGVFHHAPTPADDPFVRVGDSVAAGQQVSIIEAMKVFTAVNATEPGTISKIHVHNGQDVAAGDILFTLVPGGSR